MSTASGLPTEDLASSLLATKGGSVLEACFAPQNIAVIGATEKPGSNVIGECVEAGVRAVVIISAGFKGARGRGRDARTANRGKSAARPDSGHRPRQSRGNEPNDWPERHGRQRHGKAGEDRLPQSERGPPHCNPRLELASVGFSAFVSVGEMLDVGWGDLIDYLSNDTHTQSIVIYMEPIGDARSFLSAAREVALTKPVIVIKPGHTEEGSRAAVTHTGSMTGNDAVLDDAFRRRGVLRVDRISELFSMAEIPTPSRGSRDRA